jgi:hypothetical protein
MATLPTMDSAAQTVFDFDADRGGDGYRAWRDQRRLAMLNHSRKLGLPLGRKVEIWLRNEIRLVGTLRLREDELLVPDDRSRELQLSVDNVPFQQSELTSCVALDRRWPLSQAG